MRQHIFVPNQTKERKNLIGIIFEQKTSSRELNFGRLQISFDRVDQRLKPNEQRFNRVNLSLFLTVEIPDRCDRFHSKARDDEGSTMIDKCSRQSMFEDEEKHRWTVSKGTRKDFRESSFFLSLTEKNFNRWNKSFLSRLCRSKPETMSMFLLSI